MPNTPKTNAASEKTSQTTAESKKEVTQTATNLSASEAARDPIAEAKRVDELANWTPTAQQSARADEGRHARTDASEVGTFGVTDSPKNRDK